jgi:hypothetical protein
VVERARVLVVDAVWADLALLGAEAAASSHAATALALAAEIDSPKNSATSKSMCAKALVDTLDRLRLLAPPVEAVDKLDDLAAKREKRRASK